MIRVLCWLAVLAAPVAAQVSFTGVDARDVATRHYYNPFDGLMLDRNPYPVELIDDAEQLLLYMDDGGKTALGAAPSSVRVMEWSPGRIRFVAVLPGAKFKAATFFTGSRALEEVQDVELRDPQIHISLKDLTLSLRGSDGAVAIVDPVGAGGYKDETTHELMTPPMRPEATRTPGRTWLEAGKYRGNARGRGYMIPARTHPDYYQGLPFVRLRRFDQKIDEYGIHGPISRGGTFPLPVGTGGEALARLRRLAPRQTVDPEALLEQLSSEGLVVDETRLVRGRISNGCIRLRARDIKEMYSVLDALPDGAPVTISYEPDPHGAAHPFPWETRRFAVATKEKDEDGLTVMYTGAISNPAGEGEASLPFPTPEKIAALEQKAERAAKGVKAPKLRKRPIPAPAPAAASTHLDQEPTDVIPLSTMGVTRQPAAAVPEFIAPSR
jgi:hypothetical protein